MSEEITPEESSFINAKRGFELFGTALAPYSASRKVAAQTMGMQWPFIGEAALAQLQATNMYPGAIRDTAILLWLCTLPNRSFTDFTGWEAWYPTGEKSDALLTGEEKRREGIAGSINKKNMERTGGWNTDRALSKPDEARDAALEWADKCGITDSSGPKFGEAFQIFFAIVTGVDAAQFRIEVEKTGGEGGDESGNV